MRWRIFEGTLDADILINFLLRSIKGAASSSTMRRLRCVDRCHCVALPSDMGHTQRARIFQRAGATVGKLE
jgi:hypothetical protein